MGAACARRSGAAPAVDVTGAAGRASAAPEAGVSSSEGSAKKAARAGDPSAQRLLGLPDDAGTGGSPPHSAGSAAGRRPATGATAAKAASTEVGDERLQGACSVLASVTEEARALERRREEATAKASELIRELFGQEARLVKAASVNGRMVFVVDGAIPDEVREQLYDCLQTDAFRRTEFARPDTREFRHHVVEYSVDKLRRTELFRVVDRLVDVLFCQERGCLPLNVYRIYTNAIQFGDAAFVHRDSSEQEHVTALLYPNPEWAPELGGETVFYDESGEIVEAVEPRAGRLVLFRGNILHKGSPPTRLFWGCRYTTAFKFAPAEEKPSSPRRSSLELPNLDDDRHGLPAPPS